MEKLIQFAKDIGIEIISLEVRSDNKRYVDSELMHLDLR